VLRDHRFVHIREILRSGVGDLLRVGLLEGPRGQARITAIGRESVRLEVEFEDAPPPRPLVDLVLAVPRSRTLEKVLPQIAALGVDRLFLVNAWRVPKPYLSQRVLDPEAYRLLLYEGLMQARCTRVPQVFVQPVFKPWVQDEAPGLFDGAVRLVAHPEAEQAIETVPLGAAKRLVLAVGPEGGWLPYEVERFQDAGFLPVCSGERILRVETACVALLAQTALLRRMSLGESPDCGSLPRP